MGETEENQQESAENQMEQAGVSEESLRKEEGKTFRSKRVDSLQEKMNTMDVERRKTLFRRVLLGVVAFIVLKMCIGIGCSRMKIADREEQLVKDSVAVEDSLERIADQILGYEFQPKGHKKDTAVDKVLQTLVEADRAESARDSAAAKALKDKKD